MKKLLTLVVVGLALLAVPAAAPAQEVVGAFPAYMLGVHERPTPVNTSAFGQCDVLFFDDGSVYYYCEVYGINSVPTGAHFHVGGREDAGPIVFDWFRIIGRGDGALIGIEQNADGTWNMAIDGYLSPQSFMPAGGLQTYEDALMALVSERMYANVHTRMWPGGEIRGQVQHVEGF